MNTYFKFKQFTVHQEQCAMKVSTDSCLFGAWVAKVCVGQNDQGIGLDIGAGTGLLSLMLAQESAFNFDAIEIDPSCFAQCQRNIQESPWASRINGILGDVRWQKFHQPYDLIISNPPFYEHQLTSQDQHVNAAKHSSKLGLTELLTTVRSVMKTEGKFAVLMPYYRYDELFHEAQSQGLHAHQVCLVRHSPSHPWYRTMAIFRQQPGEVVHTTLEVRDSKGVYSEDFSKFLDKFYL